jgi:hypothetical protein
MLDRIDLIEGRGDFAGSAPIVADLIRSLAAGSPPDRWEQDIAYNYLVHQGVVTGLGVRAFPYLIALLNKSLPDRHTRESVVHLCPRIFPATQRSPSDRQSLLGQIGDLLQPDREWSDKVYLLSAYIRVAVADDYLADSLERLLGTTCPGCGEPVLTRLAHRNPR